MTITLKDPSGHTLDTDSRSGSLDPGQYNEYPLKVAPPSGGWQPGTYEFCNQVVATGINGCIYINSICKDFTGPPDQPDLEITDVWEENGTIYYKIKNMGAQTAGESNTSLTVDGVLMTSDSVALIDPSVEVTETFDYSWECTDINDNIEVCADHTNAVTEYNESNNCRTLRLTCSPNIWISPTLFNIKLLPDVVSNHILTIGNSGNSLLEFNITNEFIQSGWPNTTGGRVSSSPALGDIDGDGDIEVVVGSDDHKVYVWDCFGTYDSNNIEWGMFHHDINHTGLYGYVPPGTGGTGSQTALKEVAWLSEYPTNGAVDPGTQASITVTLDTTSLDFGDYYADIIITSNDPDENPQIIPVHLTVGHTDIGGFAADFGRADCIGNCPGDSDGDEDVDGSDLAEFAKNLGLQNP